MQPVSSAITVSSSSRVSTTPTQSGQGASYIHTVHTYIHTSNPRRGQVWAHHGWRFERRVGRWLHLGCQSGSSFQGKKAHTYIHTCIKKYAYSTYTCIHEGIYINIDKYTYIDTYIHDYIHAYIHTWLRTCIGISEAAEPVADRRHQLFGSNHRHGGGGPDGWNHSADLHALRERKQIFSAHSTQRHYIHIYIHALIYTYTHPYIHTYLHTYTHTFIYTYIHTYTCIHTYLHTDSYLRNTYIHALKRNIFCVQVYPSRKWLFQSCQVDPLPYGQSKSRRWVRYIYISMYVWILCMYVCMYVQGDDFDRYIIVSFNNATLVLSIGETVEEVTDSGFLTTSPTLQVYTYIHTYIHTLTH